MSKDKAKEKDVQLSAIMPADVTTVNVPLDKILFNWQDNARQSYWVDEDGDTEADKEEKKAKWPKGATRRVYPQTEWMKAALKADGQIQPIVLRPIKGSDQYKIVGGFTRYTGARDLGWTTIRAQIMPLDDEQADLTGLIDNMVRKNLTNYETAKALAEKKEKYGWSGGVIARLAGQSKSYINNLIGAYENLHPKIKKAWAEGKVGERAKGDGAGEDPVANIGDLIAWKGKPHKDQLDLWETLTSDKEEGTGDGAGAGNGAAGANEAAKPSAPSATKRAEAYAAIQTAKLAKEYKEGLLDALKWCMGKNQERGPVANLIKIYKANKAKAEAKQQHDEANE